jgi:hypothetical protein
MECHHHPDSLAYAARAAVRHAVAAVVVPQVSAVQAVGEGAVESGVAPSEKGKRDIVARGPEAGEGARS